uniref:Ig-like domain-containing protein n=1 Tax=Macrostomum lignano TaxID=282301 RepID=A0A1I8F1K8_9PLAT
RPVLLFDGTGWVSSLVCAAPLRSLAEEVTLRFRTNASRDSLLFASVNRKYASRDTMRLELRDGTLVCTVKLWREQLGGGMDIAAVGGIRCRPIDQNSSGLDSDSAKLGAQSGDGKSALMQTSDASNSSKISTKTLKAKSH